MSEFLRHRGSFDLDRKEETFSEAQHCGKGHFNKL